jgi:hypothetical protein
MKAKHPSSGTPIKIPLGAICAAWLALTGTVPATVLVTAAGYTNDFSVAPVAGDWITSTSNIAGTDATFATAADIDAFVIANNYNASGLTTALGTSVTNPPSVHALARWNGNPADSNAGLKLVQMRPAGITKAANVLLFKMQNNTGGRVPGINVAYNFGNPGAGTEQAPGWHAYYSVTGNSNWIKIPEFSTATPGLRTANLDFGGAGWSNGALVHILWVDDNAAGADTAEASYTMDNFAVTVPDTRFAITGVVVDQGAVTLTWRSQAGHVYRVERSEGTGPWEPVAARYPTGGATGDSTAFTDPAPAGPRPRAYYRVADLGTDDIGLHSITNARMSGGDVGYTLDGFQMANSRIKLESPANFGPAGTYASSINITDAYGNSGDLTALDANPAISLFYFGIFDAANPSLIPFTSAELDSLHAWSLRGGKLIIGASAPVTGLPWQFNILNSRWGFDLTGVDTAIAQTPVIPTAAGLDSPLFDGPFGQVALANQGGSSQGYFSTIPAGSLVLADNGQGQPVIFLDCRTLDLVVADGDIFTTLGGVTGGDGITSPNDILWANAIAFMDSLEDPPVITQNGNQLSTGDYPAYQWFNGVDPIPGATARTYTALPGGNYTVQVSMRCGCANVPSLNSVQIPF